MNLDPANDYSFESLAGARQCPSLAYLLGLTDSADHKISDPQIASRILTWLFDIEEQSLDAAYLLSRQSSFFSRYFPGGYHPQSPCMLTTKWSPIHAMLEQGIKPSVLNKGGRVSLTATGIWEPCSLDSLKGVDSGDGFVRLFWPTLVELFNRARQRGMWVSVIASPGWDYESMIDSLPRWNVEEIAKADRMLWRRA
ncbi:MAG TPA: hypothetical protein VN578_03800 [Candidatus Binatia bacterium]|jgi:hypothetical protein|nr:hypothetical protein [Candidatus Binatia bacterium]